ncbi:hypothetical protein QM646_02100 [Rhodococcus erythropolis]|uniref:hypothetical protein n=1 Tax=Rhodococcus erythropolis TaxID=1833 RepID=UPI003D1410ED|nr:hypothetical protein [Rhodococcus erythropolis]
MAEITLLDVPDQSRAFRELVVPVYGDGRKSGVTQVHLGNFRPELSIRLALTLQLAEYRLALTLQLAEYEGRRSSRTPGQISGPADNAVLSTATNEKPSEFHTEGMGNT